MTGDASLLPFFAYTHLPLHLQEVPMSFHVLAHRITTTLPDNADRAIAMVKLLEARDAALSSTTKP